MCEFYSFYCEQDYWQLVIPLVLGFTASSAIIGGAPDIFVSSGNERSKFTNHKAGKCINVNIKTVTF